MASSYLLKVLHLVYFSPLYTPLVLTSQIPASLSVINTASTQTFSTIFTQITPTATISSGVVAVEIHGAGYSGALAPTPEAPPPGAQTTQGPPFSHSRIQTLPGSTLLPRMTRIPVYLILAMDSSSPGP